MSVVGKRGTRQGFSSPSSRKEGMGCVPPQHCELQMPIAAVCRGVEARWRGDGGWFDETVPKKRNEEKKVEITVGLGRCCRRSRIIGFVESSRWNEEEEKRERSSGDGKDRDSISSLCSLASEGLDGKLFSLSSFLLLTLTTAEMSWRSLSKKGPKLEWQKATKGKRDESSKITNRKNVYEKHVKSSPKGTKEMVSRNEEKGEREECCRQGWSWEMTCGLGLWRERKREKGFVVVTKRRVKSFCVCFSLPVDPVSVTCGRSRREQEQVRQTGQLRNGATYSGQAAAAAAATKHKHRARAWAALARSFFLHCRASHRQNSSSFQI